MAIRLRVVNGQLVALCAARSIPQPDDFYLDDAQHDALNEKFMRDHNLGDFSDERGTTISAIIEREENNNPNRTWWDSMYRE